MEAAMERGRGDGAARASFWLAWSLAALSIAMFVARFPLLVLARSADIPSSWEANLTVGDLLGGVVFLIFPLVGALIASRRPRNAIGWILLAEASSTRCGRTCWTTLSMRWMDPAVSGYVPHRSRAGYSWRSPTTAQESPKRRSPTSSNPSSRSRMSERAPVSVWTSPAALSQATTKEISVSCPTR